VKENFKDKINTAGFDKHPENIGKGHPKGLKNRSTILKKWIEITTKLKNPVTGKDEFGTVEDKVKLALITKALSGDVAAIKEIDDTLYGKIADKQDIDLKGTININPKQWVQSK
jgi:hypothetical protein